VRSVWTYPNMDGVPTGVEEDNGTGFTNGVPTAVNTVDVLARQKDCVGVLSEYRTSVRDAAPSSFSGDPRLAEFRSTAASMRGTPVMSPASSAARGQPEAPRNGLLG